MVELSATGIAGDGAAMALNSASLPGRQREAFSAAISVMNDALATATRWHQLDVLRRFHRSLETLQRAGWRETESVELRERCAAARATIRSMRRSESPAELLDRSSRDAISAAYVTDKNYYLSNTSWHKDAEVLSAVLEHPSFPNGGLRLKAAAIQTDWLCNFEINVFLGRDFCQFGVELFRSDNFQNFFNRSYELLNDSKVLNAFGRNWVGGRDGIETLFRALVIEDDLIERLSAEGFLTFPLQIVAEFEERNI